jgi:hypothetical protein
MAFLESRLQQSKASERLALCVIYHLVLWFWHSQPEVASESVADEPSRNKTRRFQRIIATPQLDSEASFYL